MSLYKENKLKNIFRNKKLWLIIAGIIVLFIIAYFLTFVDWSGTFQKENIKINFEDNPYVLSKKENTLMNITLRNNTEKDLENLEVRINSVENTFLIFCPDSQTNDETRVVISKVASGNERIVTCSIRYDVTKDFFEGTYSFDVDYYIEDKINTKRVTLTVKK